ncbi:cytochrome P450 [Astrocystis sublimbata]|nr:cytochrome P450 [Astrocystis sublimbata]
MAGASELAQIGLVVGVLYTIGYCLYNVLFHPLSKFPGPLTYRMTVLPRTWYHCRGELPFQTSALHEQYGPVVRIAPNELSYSSPQAWRDIYGHKKAGQPEFPKYDGFYRPFKWQPRSLLAAERHEHGVLRRQMAHGFSDRSMKEQEPLIGAYVDLLISRLKENMKPNKSQNLREWYNFTTFDIIGDLSFGANGGFGCLQNSEYHPWIKLFAALIYQSALVTGLARLGITPVLSWLSRSPLFAESRNFTMMYEKVGLRMQGNSRPDFLEGLLKDKLALSQSDLTVNASLLIAAGSETTATLLSGATFYITTHPEILKKLEQEVRSTFTSDKEITLTSVGNLPYMLAVLNETLRRYPPIAGSLPRQTPKGGAMIDGLFVPEDTVVSLYQWAVNHDKRYWTEPEKFVPERWMGDAKYKNDQIDAMQPFSVGPRNCLGKNLAYAEMRLILARIIFNFNMTIDDDSRNWMAGQKAYAVWEKPPLNIHLELVQH